MRWQKAVRSEILSYRAADETRHFPTVELHKNAAKIDSFSEVVRWSDETCTRFR